MSEFFVGCGVAALVTAVWIGYLLGLHEYENPPGRGGGGLVGG